MSGKPRWSYFVLAFAVMALPLALAAETITYQAKVKDSGGNGLDGPVTIRFRMYETLAGSTVLWGETQNVNAVKGVVSVELGAVNAIPDDVLKKPELFIGLAVNSDPEMTPRSRLSSVWRAMSANQASGKTIQAGTATLSVSGPTATAAITFPTPFSAPPTVILGAPRDLIANHPFIPDRVSNITPTSCAAHFSSLDGQSASGSTEFDWIAVGE